MNMMHLLDTGYIERSRWQEKARGRDQEKDAMCLLLL
jgi:hypothetical protein